MLNDRVTTVRFSPADLAHVRFAVSPLWETAASRWALVQPERSPHHRSWARAARRADARKDFAAHKRLLDAFIIGGVWLPDFLTPPPERPLPAFVEELAVMVGTDPAVVTADIEAVTLQTPLTPIAREVARDPRPWMAPLAEALRRWHDLVIAPHWPRMQALLEADIALRGKAAADNGVGRMLEAIHETLTWTGEALVQDGRDDNELTLDGTGMPLMPSVFFSGKPGFTVRPESPVSLVYAARGVGALWETRRVPPSDQALGSLLGGTRARLMAMLEAPSSTKVLATRLRLSPASVSLHLSVLHDASLVSRHRHGKEVFYVLTDLGRRLVTRS